MALPLYNPDLFWHLSAGREIWTRGAIPRTDPFSFTMGGAPWVDFEWLFQLVVHAVESAGGLWGLRVFKALLLGLCWFPLAGLLKDRGVSATGRALALAFWAAAGLPQSDLRPDLFSLLFFSLLLRRLDRDEHSWLLSAPLFSLWSNLHAGFVFGLCLYAAKIVALKLERRAVPRALWLEAAAAAVGTLLNPFGARVWEVAVLHGAQGAAISRYIQEWGALSPRRPLQWPLHAALATFAAVAWRRRRELPPFLAITALPLAALTAASSRFGIFFAAAGAALVFIADKKFSVRAGLAGLAALTVLAAFPLSRVTWTRPVADTYVARRAVEFVVREEPVFRDLRLFNTYEWGGYLGWRRPGSKVFGDGRYLFHGQLPEVEAALASAPAFADFVARHRLDAVLIKNYPNRLPTRRRYPDGTEREFLRPWHLFLLPRERWALVHFDDQALLFVDRAKVPAVWLAAHEFRWLRPGDEDALADALGRGEVPADGVRAEASRAAAAR
ncbi:MAG: hypothetical protein SF051_08320 [Elusimicrobiota bacterium]|nr:hypothetical protein [Elusimicrobiota bacterium]